MDLDNCATPAAPLLSTVECLARAVAQVWDAVLSIAQSVYTCTVDHAMLCYYTCFMTLPSEDIKFIRAIITDNKMPAPSPSATAATASVTASVR